MNLGIKLPIEIDENWLLLIRRAWSMRLALSASVAAVISAWQTGDAYAILAAILALCGALSRLVVQPALRAEMRQSSECVFRLK
jgi:hypothetical protein